MKGKTQDSNKRDLTDVFLRSLKGKKEQYIVWDKTLGGFGVRVSQAGRVSFLVMGRNPAGKAVMATVGRYEKMKLADARAQARTIKLKIGDGTYQPPKKQKEETEVAIKSDETLRGLIGQFIEVEGKPTRYWLEKRQRMLGADLKDLLDKPIAEVTAPDLLRALDAVKKRNTSAHRMLFADLRPFFKWAKKRVPLEANPMAEADAPKAAKKRERALETHEIRAFWRACDKLSFPFAWIFKLLLLTGQRLEEVAGLRRGELDLDAEEWSLPAHEEFVSERKRKDGTVLVQGRTKNTLAHKVPLVPTAITLLKDALAKKTEDDEIVFSKTGDTAPSGESKAKLTLDGHMVEELGGTFDWEKMDKTAKGEPKLEQLIIEPGKFKRWRLHDLRRTVATGMEDLGIDTRVIEACLNHVSGSKAGIVGVYQTSKHRKKRKEAFLKWEKKLLEILGNTDSSLGKAA
jgi:integrase